MAKRLFFVDRIHENQAELQGDDAHHLTRVLRIEKGDRMEISDNRQLALAEVVEAGKNRVRFQVLEHRTPAPLPSGVHLIPALFKFDHFEWMLEKAVELGVSRISPVVAEFSDRGLEAASAKRHERWLRLIREASQQCRRWQLPILDLATPLAAQLSPAGLRLLLDEQPGGTALVTAIGEAPAVESVHLLVGPEGGWAPDERSAALAAGWRRVTLGPTILRAETAGIAALAVLLQYRHAHSMREASG